MPRLRKVLLADPDAAVLRELARALRERGYQVSVASDGSRALEVAVLRHPDVILFDSACQMVDVRTFIQILRTNPRTEEIPVLASGSAKDAEKLRHLRDGFLRKPFNLDEVLGRVAQIFRRLDASRELKNDREIEGSLKQMGIPDLLQVLSTNHRSGSLTLESGQLHGEIQLSEGRPVNARIGPIEGEKALFRLFGLKEGSFAFTPAPFTGTPRIHRHMEEALLEGLRQVDEAAVLRSKMPAPRDRIVLAPDAALTGEQHPITAEVVRLLNEPRTLEELLDLTSATDFEVLGAVKALLDKRLARVGPAAEAPVAGPLLVPAALHALRARVLRGRPAAKEAVGKIILVSESQRAVRAFLGRLRDLPGFRQVRAPTPELLGTWARVELLDGLRVELVSIPGADEARPLWRACAAGALGALALDRGPATTRLADYLAREERIPLVVLGDEELPRALRGLPGSEQLDAEPREGVRVLLEAVLKQAAA
jgi:CheY-like chemotaxis protein